MDSCIPEKYYFRNNCSYSSLCYNLLFHSMKESFHKRGVLSIIHSFSRSFYFKSLFYSMKESFHNKRVLPASYSFSSTLYYKTSIFTEWRRAFTMKNAFHKLQFSPAHYIITFNVTASPMKSASISYSFASSLYHNL